MEQNDEDPLKEGQSGEISPPPLESCDFCPNQSLNLDVLSCSHKICPVCLFRRFFIQNISELDGLSDSFVLKCGKCKTGFITKTLDELIKLSEKKNNFIKELKSNEKPHAFDPNQNCPSHKILKDFLCVDCLQQLCKRCASNEQNEHFHHNIMSKEKVCKNLKAEINNIPLKFMVKDSFDNNYNLITNKFKESSMDNFNETLDKINDLSKALEEFKKEYEQKYKIELTKVVKTLKVLKLFYDDYYLDRDEALNGRDIEALRYINSISNVLVNMDMSKEMSFTQKLNDAKNILDSLRTSSNKFNFNIKLIYDKLKKTYNFEGEIKTAHDKYITSLINLKDDKLLTTSRDYSMKIWEEKDNELKYSMESKIDKRIGCVISSLKIDNDKILTSNTNNGTIYIWSPTPGGGYAIEQSLSLHSDLVLNMIKLKNGNLVTSGKDNTIIVWKKSEGGFYEEKETIKTEKPAFRLISLENNKFGYTSDDGILNIMEEKEKQDNENEGNEEEKKNEKKYEKICELNHEGKIISLCELKNGYLFTGGTGLNGKKNNHIYIWKPDDKNGYTKFQVLSGHKADVNDILQLNDGRIVSSSRDRNLIIWKEIKNNEEIKYTKDEVLSEYPHGMFLLTQLRDGRIVTSTSNNSLIFWRKWGSLPYC